MARAATERFISEVSGSSRLLIYVGAGVTKSQAGYDWASLVSGLLREFPGSVPSRDRLQMLPPVQIASIVKELFNRRFPATSGTRLVNRIREMLYGDEEWQRGALATAVVRLCIAMASAPGRDVVVVTTNYDHYLEEALDEIGDDASNVAVPEYEVLSLVDSGDSAEDEMTEELAAHRPGVLRIVHLHGQVARERHPDELAIFSEGDYYASEGYVARILSAGMEDRDVLIVGSGLDDPPLLRVLARTAAEGNPRHRWAIFPRQGLRNDYEAFDSIDTSNDILTHLRFRMAQFAVELTVPDFFHQTAQVCFETASQRLASDSGGTTESYSQRLRAWWDEWFRLLGVDHAQGQRQSHTDLRAELPALVAVLGDPDERLKLELWVRWSPGTHVRELRLWSSSTGTWVDESTMRTVPIEDGSDFVAVRAFCQGAPLLEVPTAPRERWLRYLAVPIRVGEDPRSIPAGVLVLSSANPNTNLDRENALALRQIVRALQSRGRTILSNSDPDDPSASQAPLP